MTDDALKRKRLICLDYLGLISRDMRRQDMTREEMFHTAKQRMYYLELALDYGCSKSEIRMALGITERHLDELIKTIGNE